MNDTDAAVEARYRAMLLSLAPQERLRQAAEMFSDARKLVEESIRLRHARGSVGERKIELFRRLYECDFSESELAAIITHLTRHFDE
jgi:hypothetical protein